MIQPQRRVRVKKVDRDKAKRVKRRRWKAFESRSVLVPIENVCVRGNGSKGRFGRDEGSTSTIPSPGWTQGESCLMRHLGHVERGRLFRLIPRRVGRHHPQRMFDVETRFPFPDLVVRPEKRPCSQKRRKARTHQDEMKTRRDRRDERDGDGKGERRASF